ncbi:hypothetical protein TeGR_g3788, partial [Tetraparma gracilis]
YILCLQVTQFLCVLLFMQRFEALSASLQENSISGDFVITLFLHFCMIVVDRCIYLLKSIRSKFVLQVVTISWVFSVLHTGVLYKDSLSSGAPLMVWYIMECLYLFFSGLQISYGYPPFVGAASLGRADGALWWEGTLFSVYRGIPFLYEISLILDWACTETTLMIGDWIKLEDINSTLFLVDCNLDFLKKEKRKKGQPQPIHRKWLTGALVFVLLCLVVWAPLFVFSTGTVGNTPNQVKQVSMSLGLKNFPDLYHVEYSNEISEILDPSEFDDLLQTIEELTKLSSTERAEYRRELQQISMLPSSGQIWSITTPAKESLIEELENSCDEGIEMAVSYVFLLEATGKCDGRK